MVIRSDLVAGDDFGSCQLPVGCIRHRERMRKFGSQPVECLPFHPLPVPADKAAGAFADTLAGVGVATETDGHGGCLGHVGDPVTVCST